MSYRNRLAGIATAAVVLSGAGIVQLVAAGPAMALPPGGCDWSATANNAGSAVCTNAGVTFRVTLKCVHDGADYTNYGDWVNTDQMSIGECNSGDLLATAPNDDTASVFYQLS
jgi:hypothetical protein